MTIKASLDFNNWVDDVLFPMLRGFGGWRSVEVECIPFWLSLWCFICLARVSKHVSFLLVIFTGTVLDGQTTLFNE